ncbi:MAG: hypothetical protein ACRDKS_06555 [Actinomycetota bacterium]
MLGHLLLHVYQEGVQIDLHQVDSDITGSTTPFAVENLIDAGLYKRGGHGGVRLGDLIRKAGPLRRVGGRRGRDGVMEYSCSRDACVCVGARDCADMGRNGLCKAESLECNDCG